ncbi:hypothetical protein F3I16_16995 [Pseudomonas sp. L-22-4S-12]|uniref:hypothetical protein n=1 Tax=Pseudomonas sp. L-22-4S-12 TaxID=2610893 RepID=UPI00132BD50A|nr:hypothetical protein [Pseudomonas sp. L-22-4S-12]MWV17741.1 hypothetical protein [Pseudomonas sp. L-22-4S-12]
MEVYAGMVIGVAVLAIYLFYRYRKALALRLTPQESAQINRVTLVAMSEPRLALEMAQHLDGHARQLAMQIVAPELIKAGHRSAGEQAFAELSKANKSEPLKTILEVMLQQGESQAAQTLLQNANAQLPIDGHVVSIQLDLANGKEQEALKSLKDVCELQAVAGVYTLSRADSLEVARLQRRFNMKEAAALSIAWAWATLGADGELSRDELRAILQEFFQQDGSDRVIELAEQLPASYKTSAASVLFEAGELEPAFALLSESGSDIPVDTYDQLLNIALNANQPDKALHLIDFVATHAADELLLSLMRWHLQHSETAAVDALLQKRVQSSEQHIELRLQLFAHSHEHQPSWSAAQLQQAEHHLKQLRGKEHEGWYQLLTLEARLQAQTQLSAPRRDQTLIRTSLEQITRFNSQLSTSDKLLRYSAQAKLLHALGQNTAAGKLLDELVQQLKDHPDEDDDEYDHQLNLKDVAHSYLSIDQHLPAIALRNELNTQGACSHELSQGILLNHIRHQRLAEAIGALDCSLLLGGRNLLTPLRQAIEQQAPARARELHEQLLDTLSNGLLPQQAAG